MAENSKIEWTDHTFNPWIGCTKVSPGCANCYAETQDKFRSWTPEGWGKGKPRKRTSAANWKQPLRWDSEAAEALNDYEGHSGLHGGHPHYPRPRRPRVFCASLADWLDDEVPIEWLGDLLRMIHATSNLDWLLLTKRPENWSDRIAQALGDRWKGMSPIETWEAWARRWLFAKEAPSNVWIGTTIEDQIRAGQRIPHLIQIPAIVRFLSCEPLLGPVDLCLPGSNDVKFPEDFESWSDQRKDEWFRGTARAIQIARCCNPIHWVIAGGESGPNARPMNHAWARDLRDQCEATKTAFLFKQWGEHNEKGERVGKKAAGRKLDGVEWNQFPTTA